MCDHSEDVDELSASDDSEPEEQPNRAPFDPELDHDDDDYDDDDDKNNGEAVLSAPSAQMSFSLKGGSSAFSDRSHSIFDCLDTSLSSSTKKQEFVQPQPPHSNRKTGPSSPISPAPPKKKGVPDYLLHPERWTHYSLEDVPETSDHDNRTAAHQFLSSLQKEKQTDSPCDVEQKMVFSRPKRPLNVQVAGQLSTVRGNQREMHLSHLEEQEDEKEGSETGKSKGRGKAQSEGKQEKKDTRNKIEKTEQEKLEKEKDKEEELEEVNCGFASFKKTKTKNYRKSSEKGDS